MAYTSIFNEDWAGVTNIADLPAGFVATGTNPINTAGVNAAPPISGSDNAIDMSRLTSDLVYSFGGGPYNFFAFGFEYFYSGTVFPSNDKIINLPRTGGGSISLNIDSGGGLTLDDGDNTEAGWTMAAPASLRPNRWNAIEVYVRTDSPNGAVLVSVNKIVRGVYLISEPIGGLTGTINSIEFVQQNYSTFGKVYFGTEPINGAFDFEFIADNGGADLIACTYIERRVLGQAGADPIDTTPPGTPVNDTNDDVLGADIEAIGDLAVNLRTGDYTRVLNFLINRLNFVLPRLTDADDVTSVGAGNLDMNSFSATNLAAAIGSDDLVNWGQAKSILGIA